MISFTLYIGIALAYTFLAIGFYIFLKWFKEFNANKRNRERANKSIKQRDIELSISDFESLDKFLVRKTRFAADMQELMMAHAKPRADTLFWVGTFLSVLSLLFPIVATFLYYEIEPISSQSINDILSFRKNVGEIPKEVSLPLGRDWHILLGGITFGFLCLAAARGILTQQSNEMKTFVELGQRARYFERLNSVTQILLQADANTTDMEKEA